VFNDFVVQYIDVAAVNFIKRGVNSTEQQSFL